MALLGKVLPSQIASEDNQPVQVVIFKTTYENHAKGVPPVPMKLIGNSYS
jgi:hypothetical protein